MTNIFDTWYNFKYKQLMSMPCMYSFDEDIKKSIKQISGVMRNN